MIEKGVYWITEEVPGVPEDEQFFVTGPGIEIGNFPHFRTKADAEQFLRDKGVTEWKFERFEP